MKRRHFQLLTLSAALPGLALARKPAAGALELRTLQAGQGTPVVFLHGFGADLSAWRPLVGRIGLGPNRDPCQDVVIARSCRGHIISIRTYDPASQRSLAEIKRCHLPPARETPASHGSAGHPSSAVDSPSATPPNPD